MKNKTEVEKYLEENKDKTFNLNIILKYHGNSKIPLLLKKKKVKKEILFIGNKISGINNISQEEASKLPRVEMLKRIRKKILITTPTGVLPFGKMILSSIGKARKIKSIKVIRDSPTKENITELSKENKITVSNKAFSISLGEKPQLKDILKIKNEIEDQIQNTLKKFMVKYYLYTTFNPSCPLIF